MEQNNLALAWPGRYLPLTGSDDKRYASGKFDKKGLLRSDMVLKLSIDRGLFNKENS